MTFRNKHIPSDEFERFVFLHQRYDPRDDGDGREVCCVAARMVEVEVGGREGEERYRVRFDGFDLEERLHQHRELVMERGRRCGTQFLQRAGARSVCDTRKARRTETDSPIPSIRDYPHTEPSPLIQPHLSRGAIRPLNENLFSMSMIRQRADHKETRMHYSYALISYEINRSAELSAP